MLVAAVLVAWAQPRMVARFERLTLGHDTYTLPSPQQTVVASLGYRSALADLIFAHVLVQQGLHFQEKRLFEFVGNYLDTINELDPKFRAPYYLADTLLTLQSKPPPQENFVKARQIIERGMDELPNDSRLWIQGAQYIAYLGPARFQDPKVKREWRLAGARRLARGCELIADDDIDPHQCITAAGLLSRAGEIEATIQFLERVLVVTDNEEIQELARGLLERHAGERERVEWESRLTAFQRSWQQDLRFVSKHLLLVLGPPFDPARCAGALPLTAECATTWRAWHALRSASARPHP